MPQSNSMHRLVYYSRNLIPADHTKQVIEGILDASRRNNSKAGVTGALIFNSGIFAQVLEGARDAISQTFERIQRDDRHGDVLVLAFEEVTDRIFPQWSMGHIGRNAADIAAFETIATRSGFDSGLLKGEKVLEIMTMIAVDEERRAA
jgi:hypothetical protein